MEARGSSPPSLLKAVRNAHQRVSWECISASFARGPYGVSIFSRAVHVLREQALGRHRLADQALLVGVVDEPLDVGPVAGQAIAPGIAAELDQLVLEILATPGQPRPVRIVVQAEHRLLRPLRPATA